MNLESMSSQEKSLAMEVSHRLDEALETLLPDGSVNELVYLRAVLIFASRHAAIAIERLPRKEAYGLLMHSVKVFEGLTLKQVEALMNAS